MAVGGGGDGNGGGGGRAAFWSSTIDKSMRDEDDVDTDDIPFVCRYERILARDAGALWFFDENGWGAKARTHSVLRERLHW
jgi:hypothetical protein